MTDRTRPPTGAVRHLIPADDPGAGSPAGRLADRRPESPQRLAARRRHTHQRRTLLHGDRDAWEDVARRVRRLRAVQKLDPIHLAIAAKVPLSWVEAIETAAASTHQLTHLRRLAATLGTSIGYLLDGAPSLVEPEDHPAVVTLAHLAVQTGLPTSVVLDRAVRAWARIVAAADADEHLWISTPGADLIERIQFPTHDGGGTPDATTGPAVQPDTAQTAPPTEESDGDHGEPGEPAGSGDGPPLWAVSPDLDEPGTGNAPGREWTDGGEHPNGSRCGGES